MPLLAIGAAKKLLSQAANSIPALEPVIALTEVNDCIRIRLEKVLQL
jgi:hypothetical protein